MKTVLRGVVVLVLTACSSGGSKAPGTSTGGAGGEDSSDGGSGGSTTHTGGAGGTKPASLDAAAATGGSTATGGAGDGGSAGAADAGTGTGGGTEGGSGGATGGSGAGGAGGIMGWYEAEAIPPNEKAPKSEVHVNPATACKTIPPMPGEKCNAGGGEVTWITEGRQGWLQFNQVSAPADGMYDVTWWYHCGNNDNFHDPTCRGEPHTAAGCRPGEVTVNGVALPKIYEFPCFPGSWGEIHAATTTVPLKAGANTIKMTAHYTNNDAIDIDAIAIYAAGKGVPPSLPKSGMPGVVAK
jgi:hypothetical protein